MAQLPLTQSFEIQVPQKSVLYCKVDNYSSIHKIHLGLEKLVMRPCFSNRTQKADKLSNLKCSSSVEVTEHRLSGDMFMDLYYIYGSWTSGKNMTSK